MLVDTNVLVRHLVDERTEQSARATAFLRDVDHLILPAVVVAELVYVLESVYGQPPSRVATLTRSVLAHPPIEAPEEAALLRALALYETRGVHFAEACLAAMAEADDGVVVSFDRDLDRVDTVTRIEP